MIVEGTIVNHDSESYGQVEINTDTGIIERVGNSLGEPDIKTNGLILPGFIDVHVHAREDVTGQQSYKEDYTSASEAAIHGGVVHFADMPNKPVPPVDDNSYNEQLQLTKRSLVDVTLYAGIGPHTSPISFPVPYKVFMGKSVGELFFTSNSQLENTLSKYKGQNVSFHCEDPEILESSRGAGTHHERRPKEAEIKAMELAIELIKKYDINGKIVHVSTAEGVEIIRDAKKRGVRVTAEATPHHLYFDQSAALQMNPPLREAKDGNALLQGLKDGTIDYIATDHAPHTLEEKERGISGLPLLDTYGAFAAWLIKEHSFSTQDIARVCSYNPGRFVNQFNERKWGKIEKGFVGSLTVIDMDNPITVKRENLKTKAGWSPFEDHTFPGRVTHTIVRGKVYVSA